MQVCDIMETKVEQKVEPWEARVEVEQKVNPWEVSSVEAFLYYNCPECDVKAKDSDVFMSHALECHELARHSLSQIDQEPVYDQDDIDIKPEISLEEEEEEFEDPTWEDELDRPIFQCDICVFKCDSSTELVSHRKREHQEPKQYECDKCDYKGASLKSLKRHKQLQHCDKPPVHCEVCHAEFKNEEYLKKHVKSRHAEPKWYNCDTCDYKSKSSYQVKIHKMKKHDDIKPHVCHICGKGFSAPSALNNHLASVHNKDGEGAVCDKCGKSFNNPRALKDHMYNNHKLFMLCTLCERVFTSKYKLRSHMKTEHDFECNLDQLFICHICHNRHNSYSDMNDHFVNEHEHKNEHLCTNCDKVVSSKMLLTIHQMEAHEFNPIDNTFKNAPQNLKVIQEKIDKGGLPCDQCHKVFSSHRTLTDHRKQFHDKSNHIKCDLCDFTSFEPYRIKKHKQLKHEAKHLKCNECGYACSTQQNLRRHISEVHLKIRPHKCTKCDMAYERKRPLALHMLQEHNILLKYK